MDPKQPGEFKPLGSHSPMEVRRLLDRFEVAEIPFQIESDDERGTSASVYVSKKDWERAHDIHRALFEPV